MGLWVAVNRPNFGINGRGSCFGRGVRAV